MPLDVFASGLPAAQVSIPMKSIPPAFIQLAAACARPLGLNESEYRKLSSAAHEEHDADWNSFAQLLHTLDVPLGGAAGIEALGANTCLGFRPYRQLVDLYFALEELYELAALKFLPHLFGNHVQTSFRRQPDNTFRITLSLDRQVQACFPFWLLMLGHFRAMPHHLGLPFAVVDVEFGEHFGDYIVVPTANTEEVQGPANNVRKTVREQLIDDLLLCATTGSPGARQAFTPDWLTKIPTPENAPVAIRNPDALEKLLRRMQQELHVSALRLSGYLPSGLWPLGAVGDKPGRATLRRTFWVHAQPVACIDVERETSGDPSAINAELDERAPDYVESIIKVLDGALSANETKFAADTAALLNEPLIAEPPPSSRGRFRSARNSRVGEMAKVWNLTPRQGSVMALLVEGLANKEIAMRLGCSVGTIENHVTCILRRANVTSRAALTAAFWGRINR
jgi:DNA-binding CsgD family transcriptional regulator